MNNKRAVWIAMHDDDTAAKLLEIASRHMKLTLEHVNKDTTADRRKEIKDAIECLRYQRNEILLKKGVEQIG